MEAKEIELKATDGPLLYHVGQEVIPVSSQVAKWIARVMSEGKDIKILCGHCQQTFEFKASKIITGAKLSLKGTPNGSRIQRS